MPKDHFKNILYDAMLRNKYEFSNINSKKPDLYNDYQRNKYLNKQKMKNIFDKTPHLTNQEGLPKKLMSVLSMYIRMEKLFT